MAFGIFVILNPAGHRINYSSQADEDSMRQYESDVYEANVRRGSFSRDLLQTR